MNHPIIFLERDNKMELVPAPFIGFVWKKQILAHKI